MSYSAARLTVDGVDVIRLADTERAIGVSIAPGIGNMAYEMNVHGTNMLWTPYRSVAEFRAKPAHLGIPFLAPWANRLDADAFWANGKKYLLNPGLGNFHRDNNGLPIHGLVTYSPHWKVMAADSDDSAAFLTSRLEFWRYPDYMAQFPFAHTMEMTYRLAGGSLEVHTAIANLSAEAMPLSLAYHPYFTLTDAPRDEWTVHVAAREHVVVDQRLIPTGEQKPLDLPAEVKLAARVFDDVFAGVDSQDDFRVRGKQQQIALRYGPKYPVAVVYAPPGRDFICFEPMTGVTNAFNLAHEGKYEALQTIAPGETWSESFRITPTGF